VATRAPAWSKLEVVVVPHTSLDDTVRPARSTVVVMVPAGSLTETSNPSRRRQSWMRAMLAFAQGA